MGDGHGQAWSERSDLIRGMNMLACPYKKSNRVIHILKRLIAESERQSNYMMHPGNIHQKFWCGLPREPYTHYSIAMAGKLARTRALREALYEFEKR